MKKLTEIPQKTFLMNFPLSVSNDIANNVWMPEYENERYNHDLAFSQWHSLYKELVNCGCLVYILPSEEGLQDQTFTANLGCYLPHIDKPSVILSNFKSPPRMREVIPGIDFFRYLKYRIYQPPYHFEGEADLKYVRDDIYFGGYGIRTDLESYHWMMTRFNMTIIPVKMHDEKLYHFDCCFLPLNSERALVATQVLSEEDIRKIENVVEVIQVPDKYLYSAWTNSIIARNKIFHSPYEIRSQYAFTEFAWKHGLEPVMLDLSEFRKSGADSSCLVMSLNFPKKT